MEIVNQNSINTTQERLDEMKAEKQANIQVLKEIQDARILLSQERGSFVTFKEESLSQIESARNKLALEEANFNKK